jgi:SAM-dependent methyltransferase
LAPFVSGLGAAEEMVEMFYGRAEGDMSATTPVSGSAEKWGRLWGARPMAWAENEELQVPTYEEAIRRVGVAPGQRVLDIGCGTGVFLRLAADHGARPFGLDASEALLEIARARVPEADLRVGEMEQLPYDPDTFDLVTGFNSFFFAAKLVAALREAGRVAKPGAPVVIQVWGRPERCDLEAQKQVARRYAPPPPPDAPPPPKLWEPGVLERLATGAGLTPETAFDTGYAFEYHDNEMLTRLLTAPMGLAELAGPEREYMLRRELIEALAPYRAPDGSYQVNNEFHYLVARA